MSTQRLLPPSPLPLTCVATHTEKLFYVFTKRIRQSFKPKSSSEEIFNAMDKAFKTVTEGNLDPLSKW